MRAEEMKISKVLTVPVSSVSMSVFQKVVFP